jgi:hypothetical protein
VYEILDDFVHFDELYLVCYVLLEIGVALGSTAALILVRSQIDE